VGGLWGVGTTWQGEFLPIGVKSTPVPVPAVSDAIAAGTVQKLDLAALPAGVTVTTTEHTTERDVFLVDTPEDLTLEVFTFYWGGWAAYVDNHKLAVWPRDPEGWITFRIPAGQHTVRVELLETKRRLLGWALSDLTVLAALAGAYYTLRPRALQRAGLAAAAPQRYGPTGWLLAGVVALGLVGRYGLDVGIRWQAARAAPAVPAAQTQVNVNFDNQAQLAAYDLPQTSAHPGDGVPMTFYWLMRAPTEAPASVFVHLYGPDGQLWGQSDKPDPVVFFPTTRWPLGRVLADAHTVQIKPDAPPGVYRLAVGLWDRATGQRSHPLDAAGQPLPDDVFTLTDQFVVSAP
jgi:hypothetical protein